MVQLTFNFGDIINASNLEPQIKEQIQKHSYIPIPERLKYINQLRKSAESLLKQSENINTEISGNWTHRRQSFADSAQRKKDKLIKTATTLNRIADLWDDDNCPAILQGIRSAGDLEAHYPRAIENNDGWYKDEYPKILKKSILVLILLIMHIYHQQKTMILLN